MTARRRRRVILVALIAVGATAPVDAAPESPQPLAAVIHAAARWAGIAPELLAAVVWVESRGHPWALSIRGEALYPRSRAEAHALLQASRGHADIGVAQIHYPIWGPVFGLRPEDMLDAGAAWITIRGVNKRIAEILIAELGPDMHVFPTAKHAASWAGLCPGNHESAGKHRSGRTRHGNRWLRAALIEPRSPPASAPLPVPSPRAIAGSGTGGTKRRSWRWRMPSS
jgi:hypothetical protein